MDSELIAIAMVLLVVAAVLMIGVGRSPTPLDLHIAAVRAGSQAHLLATGLAERLPR